MTEWPDPQCVSMRPVCRRAANTDASPQTQGGEKLLERESVKTVVPKRRLSSSTAFTLNT